MSSLPPEVLSSCLRIGLGMFVFWLMQPLVFYHCLVTAGKANHSPKPLWLRGMAALWYGATMYVLADALRTALGEYYSFNVNLIWWIYALTSVKYVHAVLSPTFGNDLGLTTWQRIVLFCYLPATVVFPKDGSGDNKTTTMDASSTPVNHQQPPPQRSALFYVGRGLAQLVVMGQVAQFVLDHGWDKQLPTWSHSVLAYNLIMLSQGGFADVAFSATTRAVVGPHVHVVEPSDVPVLATIPRYFWARWSKSAGYHLRRSIYDPLGGRAHRQWVSTFCTFGFNCLLHVLWWGYVSAGKLALNYIPLLVTIPMASLALDKFVMVPYVKRYSLLLYHVVGWLTLQGIAVYGMPYFMDAQGLPTNLHDLCMVQTGQM